MGWAANVIMIVYIIYVDGFFRTPRHRTTDHKPIAVILETRTAFYYNGTNHKTVLAAKVRAEMVLRNVAMVLAHDIARVMSFAVMVVPIVVLVVLIVAVRVSFSMLARSAVIVAVTAMVVIVAIVLGHGWD
jgi:hypothetical protein